MQNTHRTNRAFLMGSIVCLTDHSSQRGSIDRSTVRISKLTRTAHFAALTSILKPANQESKRSTCVCFIIRQKNSYTSSGMLNPNSECVTCPLSIKHCLMTASVYRLWGNSLRLIETGDFKKMLNGYSPFRLTINKNCTVMTNSSCNRKGLLHFH